MDATTIEFTEPVQDVPAFLSKISRYCIGVVEVRLVEGQPEQRAITVTTGIPARVAWLAGRCPHRAQDALVCV
jgi:hypothetical protein